ncbi:MAG: tetratricopeptide repeat protein [Planctomycetota bacterium]|nr:tetratricopeptide repeat protein [Planctomycetota bacterium]
MSKPPFKYRLPVLSLPGIAVLLVLACALAGRARAEEKPAGPPQAAAAPTKDGALFERVLQLHLVQEPELDLTATRQEFDKLVAQARAALANAATPREKVVTLNKVLLADRNVSYLSNKYWRDSTLAASLLRRQGNCLATTTLYVLAGHALDLPIRMVLVPRHAFARWDDGQTRINIETTAKGAEFSDSDYFSRWSQPSPLDIEKLGWGRSLDDTGVYAELLVAAAYHRAGESRLEDALKLFDQALELRPHRTDTVLHRYETVANIAGRRNEARDKIIGMLNDQKTRPLPPSVEVGALSFLAHDAAGAGDHQRERAFLMMAFARAPKASQLGILTELAFCLRALKDYRGAVRYMELAVALQPDNDGLLYNLAILQKNDGRLKDALATIAAARRLNPESWNLQMIEAGYQVLDGQREKGLELYAKIERPRGDVEFYDIMQAWFHAVSQQREGFYKHFEYALSHARSTSILEWIDQDVDLDVYRNENEFKALVEKHRARLLEK